jgi:hypothetical protein
MSGRSRHVSVKEFDPRRAWTGLTSGVSLHAHTHHSRETLADVHPYIRQVPIVAAMLERRLEDFADARDGAPDFSKGWWNPPVTPRQVFDGEVEQIERRFGLAPIVSITDHDDIAANLELQALYAERCAPISFEWTVPYRRGYFHLGVHNLPRRRATRWFHRLAEFSRGTAGEDLGEILEDLHANRDVLVVFNHPCWDLAAVGENEHQTMLVEFMAAFGRYLHAVEFNGYRSRRENNRVRTLGSETGLPLISGGDRHGRAVNAVVNVTTARSFAEFVHEVRDGVSHVVVMPEYRQHLVARMLACAADVFRHYRRFPDERRRWTDRVSWISHGRVRPLSAHWPTGGPFWLRSSIRTFQVIASPVVLPIVTAALDRLDPERTGA